jgi:hypothetical protein
LVLVFVDTNSGGRNLLSVPYFSKSLHSKNPFKNHFFASLLALSVLPSTVLSSETKNLDEIVVKGLRINTTLEESGSSISILTNEMIKARGYVFALDALASASGVTIKQNGPFGGQASARIRGSASQQTLVLVDGMVVNDTTSPGGGFNFGGYDASNIERIEVLKGPQSTLWGSDAMCLLKPVASVIKGSAQKLRPAAPGVASDYLLLTYLPMVFQRLMKQTAIEKRMALVIRLSRWPVDSI